MNTDELEDFLLEGGDELMNSEPCPKCKEPTYLDQAIEWVDGEKGTCICPHCGEVIYMDREIEWIDKDKKTVKCPKCGGEVCH